MAELAKTVLTRLPKIYRAHADAERAPAMKAYMRDQFPFLGISSTVRSEIDREVLAGLGKPTEDDLAEIARACWQKKEREYQYFATKLLRRWAARVASAAFLEDVVRPLITEKSWWDTVDELAAHVVSGLVEKHPELATNMDAWAESENLWLARAAILHQLRYRKNTDAKRLFAYCRARAGEKDFFMRKAIGWALRVYADAGDPEAVAAFVEKNASRLSPLSKKEAMRGVDRARAVTRR